MRNTILIFTLCIPLLVGAQNIKVNIKAQPAAKATYTLDGEEMGSANGKTVRLGFNARKGMIEHVIEISANGYESEVFKFDIDSKQREKIECNLQRKLPRVHENSTLVLDVEKVVSGIEYGTDVGSNTRWKYRFNEEINLSTQSREFDKAIRAIGLSTLGETSDDLFDTGKSKPKNPDILIAGRIEHFSVDRGTSNSYSSEMRVNWQLYDRYDKKIILKNDVESEYYFSTSIISEEFHKAIIDNFYMLLAADSNFVSAIESVDATTENRDSVDIEDDETLPDVEKIGISSLRLDPMEEFSDLVELAMNASVTVIIDQDRGHGSGVVISGDGYIVTNHHVIDEAKLIDVQFSNGIMLAADVITSSEKHDLALIKVRAGGLTALPIIDDSEKAREGDEVMVIGAPGDKELGQSVSKGIISAKRTIDGVRIIQTDTKISPGNSGSPLVNDEGEIIGIINMKMVGEGIEGLSFAIDSKYIYSVLGIEYE